jgi:excisionase family DNA binding protein
VTRDLDRELARRLGPEEILTVTQAARFLGVARRSLYEAIGRLEVPHRRIGRRIVLSRAALVRWLDSCEAPARNGA